MVRQQYLGYKSHMKENENIDWEYRCAHMLLIDGCSTSVISYVSMLPLDKTHLDAVRGLIQTKMFRLSASTKRAQLSVATTTVRSTDLFNIMSSPESMLIRQD